MICGGFQPDSALQFAEKKALADFLSGLAKEDKRLPNKVSRSPMKLLTEYLDRAINLERLAASEQDSMFKNELLKQAASYRRMAAKRAEQYGLPPPSPPEIPT
jgi:hypothetical protein